MENQFAWAHLLKLQACAKPEAAVLKSGLMWMCLLLEHCTPLDVTGSCGASPWRVCVCKECDVVWNRSPGTEITVYLL